MQAQITCLKSRTYKFRTQAQNGTFVTVRIPDLSRLPRASWGDWGPMVEIDTSQAQSVALVEFPQSTMTFDLSQTKVVVKSPALAKERHRSPHYLELKGNSPMSTVKIYFDGEDIPYKCVITSSSFEIACEAIAPEDMPRSIAI